LEAAGVAVAAAAEGFLRKVVMVLFLLVTEAAAALFVDAELRSVVSVMEASDTARVDAAAIAAGAADLGGPRRTWDGPWGQPLHLRRPLF
jgi:hypothetical protein